MAKMLFLGLMAFLRYWPLPCLRALGWGLGYLLYYFAPARRKVVLTNLRLCFPELNAATQTRLARQHVIFFAQALLDRSWLWGRSQNCLRKRLHIQEYAKYFQLDTQFTQDKQPIVLFAPHFIGIDACATALSIWFSSPFISIYLPQSVEWINQWMLQGRTRFGNGNVYSRYENPKIIAQAIRRGERLFLSSDMDFGRTLQTESLFIPFFGEQAATIPSLSRFARIGRAKVIMVVASLNKSGYTIKLQGPWQDFPSKDEVADTTRMNHELETVIQTMPAQYFWVHRRFKTRPKDEPDIY